MPRPLLAAHLVAHLVAGVLCAAGVTAQTLADAVPTARPARYVVDVWRGREGLPQSTVRAIRQAADGALWIGTQEGLVRFDGLLFEPLEASLLAGEEIVDLHIDAKDHLWSVTGRGRLLRIQGGEPRLVEAAGYDVACVAAGRGDTVLIGTRAGHVLRVSGDQVEYVAEAPPGMVRGVVSALLETRDGTIHVGSLRGVITRHDRAGTIVLDKTTGLPPGRINALVEGNDGSIWAGVGVSLVRLRDEAVEIVWESRGAVRSLGVDAGGDLWVATYGTGLHHVRQNGESEAIDGLPLPLLHTALVGREGETWVGSNGGGLARVRSGPFSSIAHAQGLSGNMATALLEDRAGRVWVGTYGHALNRIDPDGSLTFGHPGLTSFFVSSLHEGPDGILWVGTLDRGLFRIAGERAEPATDVGVSATEVVFVMTHDDDGAFWLGTTEGLVRWHDGVARRYGVDDGLLSNRIVALAPVRGEGLWVGTLRGVNRIQDGKVTGSWSPADGLPDSTVFALYPEEQRLWIGTLGGLAVLENGVLTALTKAHGLCDNKVFAILADDHGSLWLSSNNGVSRLSRDELLAVARGQRDQVSCLLLTESAGMAVRECNGGTQPTAFRARDGRLWFSTVQGVAILDPAAVGPPDTPPSARLVRVAINGTPVPSGPRVRVHRDRGELEFHFAAVSLRDPLRMRFRHRLVAFDSDWIEVGGSRTTRYTNLPAGTYEFEVAAALDRGPWGAPARLEVTLTPRFWETRQALALLGTLGVALLVLFHAARVRRERALARAVAERTRDLAEAKGRLEEWNQRQSRFVSGVSHELRTPLTLIRFYTELLVDEPEEPPEERERAYRILVREGERLNRVIERVMQFTRIENRQEEYRLESGSLADVIRQTVDSFSGYLESAGFRVDVDLDPRAEAAPVQFDANAVAAAVANLLENAIKYSRAERWVGIRLRLVKEGAAIEVEDRGIGIRPEDIERIFERFYRGTDDGGAGGYGIGLFIVRDIMVAHGGRVEVESRLGSSSVFRLVFPGTAAAVPSADRVAVKTGGE